MMAASTCRAAEKSARELHETKLRAVKFYKENRIPEKLEDILNSLFFENPADVYGRLVRTELELFRLILNFSKLIIIKLQKRSQ